MYIIGTPLGGEARLFGGGEPTPVDRTLITPLNLLSFHCYYCTWHTKEPNEDDM